MSDTVVYESEFFAPFSPRTALDMVERVPGFAIDEGEERRGFAGAQGNVLIDGEPPSSKAQEIDDILARIPASDVLRIELVRGAAGANAQSVRVNVVRRVGDGDGVWELGFARSDDGRVSPSGEAAYSGRSGELSYGLSAAVDSARYPVRGERFDYDEMGQLDERHDERLPADEREGRLAGEAALPLLGWRTSLNAQISRVEYDERLSSKVFDAVGTLNEVISGELEERETIGEVGVSLRRQLGVWEADWGGVLTRRRFEAEEATSERDGGGVLDEATRQLQRVDSGESILRGTLGREVGERWSLEFGAEFALNTLEQSLELTEDTGGGPVPVVLPSANVRVEEERAEISAAISGALSSRWSLEASLAGEASRLRQSGDSDTETALSYLKPSLQFVRSLGASNQMRFRVYRDVSQLDFEDFVSAADIQNAVVNAGNPNLRPETSWRVEAAGDWRFGDDGAFAVTLYRWAIEDTVDLVPVGPPGDRFDAPGNIGDATLWGARVQLTWPLPLDATLRIDAMAQRTEVSDPLTSETRAISESDESAFVVAFRQDIARFAWGVDYEREVEAPSYRFDRVERERDAEELTLWLETTAFGGFKLRAWAENVTDSAERRRRTLFDPDRLGAFDGSDSRARRTGVTIGLSASGSF